MMFFVEILISYGFGVSVNDINNLGSAGVDVDGNGNKQEENHCDTRNNHGNWVTFLENQIFGIAVVENWKIACYCQNSVKNKFGTDWSRKNLLELHVMDALRKIKTFLILFSTGLVNSILIGKTTV